MVVLFVAAAAVGFAVLTAVLSLIVVKLTRKYGGNVDANMRWLADTLELSLLGGDSVFPKIAFLKGLRRPLRIEGHRRGCDVSLYHYSTGGEHSTTYATVRIAIENPKGLKLGFSRESFLGKIGTSLGMQDVQTNDEHFDRLFIVKCSDPGFVKRALLPEIKDRFYEVWEAHQSGGAIALKDNVLSYNEVGMIRSEAARNRIAAVAELMCDLGGLVQFYNQGR